MWLTHSILFVLPLLAVAQYGALDDVSGGPLMTRMLRLKGIANKVVALNQLGPGSGGQFGTLAWSKPAEKHEDGKNDPATKSAAEAAAHAGILHGEKTQGWHPKADYSIRGGIHGPTTPQQEQYFKNNPGQNWVTVQGADPGSKQSIAHHIPVNAQGQHEPNVPVFSAGPNQNKGKTAAPGKGSKVNLPQHKRWVYERALEIIEARHAALDEFDAPIYARDAYPDADYEHDVYARSAYADPEAFFEEDEYEY